jgi:predicted transposase YdaD
LEELIDAPPSVAQYSVRFTFPLLDLTQVPDESLARDPFLKSVLHLLKYSRRDEFSDWFEQILRWLLEPSATSFRKEHVDVFLVYVMATSQSIPAEVLSMTLQKVFPTQIEPGSIADQLLKRGRQDGRQEGRQEAMQEFEISLIQILQECLGVPVESTSSLQSCSLDELRLKTADLRSQIQRRLKP